MIDTRNIITSYGTPPKEYTLYPECEYLFCDMTCIYKGIVVEPDNDSQNALIHLEETGSDYTVPITNLSPIALTVEYFDHDQNRSSVDIATGIKTWEYPDSVIPYKIQYNGKYFSYTDINTKGESPLPITFLSDLQAVRSSYIS